MSQIWPETVQTHFSQGFAGKQAAAAQYPSWRAAQVTGVLVGTVGHKGPAEDGVGEVPNCELSAATPTRTGAPSLVGEHQKKKLYLFKADDI